MMCRSTLYVIRTRMIAECNQCIMIIIAPLSPVARRNSTYRNRFKLPANQTNTRDYWHTITLSHMIIPIPSPVFERGGMYIWYMCDVLNA